VGRPVEAVLDRAGDALGRDGGGALADHQDPGDGTGRKFVAEIGRQRFVPQANREPPGSRLCDDLAPQRLAEGSWRLRDLLQKEVGKAGPVDVSSRDLGGTDFLWCHGQRIALVVESGQALERPRATAVEGHDLTVGRLAVQAQVAGGLLDQSVGLAGHDEGVVRQSDLERLAAAPQGQMQPVGIGRRAGTDGHGAVKTGNRGTERLVHRHALGQPA
jgi:hypothetical protein